MGKTRVLALLVGVILCTVAVSNEGTIAFIGLYAPHAARRVVATGISLSW
ncbi:iron chelate uptake ABC transporter family permease subunit [Cytobacillus firmus]|nr:iron chelate uptake ABC transporter family permease subunit [Cytobacillus firmus]